MKCYLCSKKAIIKQQKNRSICNVCFLKLIEKRVRKNARINKLFSKGDKIKVKDKLCKYFVESIAKNIPIEISTKGEKEVLLWTIDDEVGGFLENLFKGEKVKKFKKNEIKLLSVLTDDEAKMFAKLKKIKFKVNKKDKEVSKLIDKLAEKHPNVKFNLIKNIKILREIFMKWIILLLLLTGCSFETSNVVKSVVRDSGSIENVYFCPRDDCNKELTSFILSAEKSVHCALFDLDLVEVIDALKLQSSNLDVKLVVDDHNWEYVEDLSFAKKDTSSQLSHNKFCVVDSKRVSTGSFNPTENGALKNNNNLIILESKTIAENYKNEFSELWAGKFGKGDLVKNPVVYVDDVKIKSYFCPEDDCGEKVAEELKKAEESIYFMTFSFTHDSIANTLLLKNLKGIEIKGIFENVGAGSKYSKFNVLNYQGIDVIRDKNPAVMHHKTFIIDNKTVITGSFNPSKNADTRNDENILIIEDSKIAEKYLEEFEYVFNG